jgi:DNA-binding PadR family transcriptional regulator
MSFMAEQESNSDGLAPVGEPGMLVLMSLSNGPKHGYAVTEDVFAHTGVRLEFGTLYPSLHELVGRGFILALRSDDQGCPYEITPAGRAALGTQSWSRIVDASKARLQP